MTLDFAQHRVRSIAIWIAIVSVLCAGITALSPSPIRSPGCTFLELVSGPLGGWIGAVRSSAFPEALGTLVPTTAISIALLWSVVARKSRLAFPWSILTWVASGYLFSIGIGA